MRLSDYFNSKGINNTNSALRSIEGKRAVVVSNSNNHNYTIGRVFTFPSYDELRSTSCWFNNNRNGSYITFDNAQGIIPAEEDAYYSITTKDIVLVSYYTLSELESAINAEKIKQKLIIKESQRQIENFNKMKKILTDYDLGVFEEEFLDTFKKLEETKDSFKDSKEFIKIVKIFNDKLINDLYPSEEEQKRIKKNSVKGKSLKDLLRKEPVPEDNVCCESAS